jgi:predicted RNA-binding Zn ribbon-like protein
MQFNHDNMTGTELSVALVNLDGAGDWSRETVLDVLLDRQVRRAELTDLACDELRGWTRTLRRVFDAATTEQRCDAANYLLAAGAGRPYLTTHDGLRPHLHFAPETDDVVGRVKAVTAGSLAIFTVEAEGTRLGVCARETCDTVFVDTSRNGRRAYCTARCGNFDAVVRHRTARRA